MHTRPLQSWARLTAPGIPALAVIRRPLRIGFDAVLEVSTLYPAPEPGNFGQIRRARQLYQQRRIGPILDPTSILPKTAALNAQGDSLLPAESSAALAVDIDQESIQSANEQLDQDSEIPEESADQQERASHHKNRKGKQSHGS
jgi:hypothetical protein